MYPVGLPLNLTLFLVFSFKALPGNLNFAIVTSSGAAGTLRSVAKVACFSRDSSHSRPVERYLGLVRKALHKKIYENQQGNYKENRENIEKNKN